MESSDATRVVLGVVVLFVAIGYILAGRLYDRLHRSTRRDRSLTKQVEKLEALLQPVSGVVGLVWNGSGNVLPPAVQIPGAQSPCFGTISIMANQWQTFDAVSPDCKGVRLCQGGNYHVDAFFLAFRQESTSVNMTAAVVLNRKSFVQPEAFKHTIPAPVIGAGNLIFAQWSGVIQCVPECGGLLSIVIRDNEETEPTVAFVVAWYLAVFRIPQDLSCYPCCPTYTSLPPPTAMEMTQAGFSTFGSSVIPADIAPYALMRSV
jgi:hypothetical protein